MGRGAALMFVLVLAAAASGRAHAQQQYVGRALGALSELHHGVRGQVFAVDARTLFLRDFHYDGEGPAAYFYVGTSGRPSAANGLRLRDERGGAGPLRRYRGEGVTLALPDGKTLKDIRWFAVWCDEYSVNFGDVAIPRELEYPRPARVGALRGVHGVSSDPLVVVDAQTLLVPNFSYDGEAPDAKFWVGRGEKPSPAGIRIPDENGKEAPLRKYDKKTIVLTLPGELTVFDIGHFAVWCEAFTVNFGHVALPRAQLQNVPPSLKMLGVSPQSKLNCEVLYDELAFEVRWAVAGDSIVLQLVAKLEDGEYMSFGVSGDSTHSQMVGGDVAVAWVDKQTLKGYAVDYYLDAKSQCAGVRGSCPDERLGAKTDSIRLLNAALVNGYSIVTYQRSLKAADQLDRPVLTNGSQPVIWALGPLNSRQEVSYHHHFTKGDHLIEFGRPPLWNCPMPEGEEEPRTDTPPTSRPPPAAPLQPSTEQDKQSSKAVIKPNPVPPPAPAPRATPWEIPPIACYEPPDGVFYAQMGPTGGKQGYSAITGHVGWGISWYINGLLIPEVTVVRGRKYTFVVEGGSDPEVPARYHPFYITNDPVGGYYHKNDEEKKGVEIYAGVRRSRSGELVPTGVGRLCNWTPDSAGPEADEFPSFGAYQRSLTLVCEEGSPGVVAWTPDRHTPDTVYYQCFTHRYLGWKINVVDSCDEEAEESRPAAVAVPPHAGLTPVDMTTDLTPDESIQVATRLRPDSNFLDERRKVEKIINTKTTYNDFSSDKDRPQDALSGEQLVVSRGQIQDIITTIESIETRMRDAAATPRNHTPPAPPALVPVQTHQYQVHEEPDAVPERPFREEDEYVVQGGRPHHNYFLPPGAHPLTLQTVLRPMGSNKRAPFRRPSPPEIKLRRPLPTAPSEVKLRRPPLATHPTHPAPSGIMHGSSHGKPTFPLAMPGHHGPYHNMKNYYGKPNFNRSPPGPSFRPQHSVPPGVTGPLPPPPKPTFGPPKVVHKQTAPVAHLPQQQTGIIMGKPGPIQIPPPIQSQTLSLGHTDIIANQVVKSHITLPGNGDSITSSSIQQSFIYQPGQIILGKPMDHPVPLDQQMTPSRHNIVTMPTTSVPEPKRESARVQYVAQVHPPAPKDDVKSSDFIGESTESSTMQPAVNTGFKPNTIVIESGFKPIIREPLMDRTDHDVVNHNRRQDSDVEEDYDESPQPITNYAYQTPSEKLTETFEPIFIPSPVDIGIPSNDRTNEVFPSNHAKEDRPHPVYVKTESELNALFGRKNMNKEVPEDMIMEADKISPQYLPPDPKQPKEHSQKITNTEQTFTTYDGKTVSAATLTSIPDIKDKNKQGALIFPDASSVINSMFTKNLLLKPQFGPLKGQIPPIVAESIKDLNSSESDKPHFDSKTTVLLPKLEDILTSSGTELDKVEVVPPQENNTKYEDDYYENYEDTTPKEANGEAEEETESNDRTKREVPGYHTFLREVREIKNQIDFQADAQSTAPRISWSSLLLLPLLLKLI